MSENAVAPRFTDSRLCLLLLVVLIPSYGAGLASDTLTHGDEAYWISAGTKSYELLFVERNLRSPDWQTGAMASVLDLHHPTETAANRNPKLGALWIGLGVHALDAPRPPRWTKEYAFGRSPEWNRARGLLPEPATLLAGRVPVVVLSLAGALAFFRLLRLLVGPGASFAGALMLATSPLVLLLCRRAMLDGSAFAFSIAAVWLTACACSGSARVVPALAAGALAGAALSCKLNAGVLVPVLGAAFAWEALRRRSLAPLLRGGLAGGTASILFLALNPTLYIAPFEGILSMLRIGSELGQLGDAFGRAALPTLASRIEAAYDLLLGERGIFASRLGLPLDGLLLAVGAAVLVAQSRAQPAARVLLLWLVVSLAAVCVWPPVRWDRYFLPAMAPVAAAECLALALGVPALVRRVRSR